MSACRASDPAATGEGTPPPSGPSTQSVLLGDATRPPPPLSGGTLLVTKAGLAVAADSDRDGVWLVDLHDEAVRSVALQPGDEPGRVVEDGAGRVHVALRGAGAVATIDLASGKITGRRSVCSAPRGIAYDPSLDVVHVACAGGELVTLPAAGGAPTRKIRFPERDLRDVVVRGDTLMVTRFRSAEVLLLDAQGNVMSRQAPHGPTQFASPPKGTPPLKPTPVVTATAEVAWRAIPDGSNGLLMLHQVATDQVIKLGPPPGAPVQPPPAAVLGNGGAGGSGSGVPIPPPPPPGQGDTGGSGSGDGQSGYTTAGHSDDPFFGLGCDGTIVKSAITSFGPRGGPSPTASPTLIGATVPVDLAIDGNGNVAVVSAGANEVFFSSQMELTSQGAGSCVSPIAGIAIAAQPIAIADSPEGFVVQTRQPASIVVLDHSFFATASKTIVLPGVTKDDPGHAVFHHQASAKSFIACASCHPEGHEDGHVWQFEFGPRRTPTASGHVLETAPLHWDGSIGDLGTLMSEVFVRRMGGDRSNAEPENVAAFGKWLDTIPPFPASPTGTEAQIAHGKQLFERADVGCTGCHSGEHFTNNRNEDVGTGAKFQVPQLLGVSARAPYLHDGCAATLAERFDPAKAACNGGESHGHTAQLAPSDVADLIAYLETL